MRDRLIFTAGALTVLLFTSCGVFSKTAQSSERSSDQSPQGKRLIVQAEDMSLTHYEINSDGIRTYIKLTESTGVAQFKFPFPSGHYAIDVSYLAEKVGQNTYSMYIAENQIISWLGKGRDDQWHMLSEQKWHPLRHIEINEGDEIRIEALSQNGSFVIFDYVQFTLSSHDTSAASSAQMEKRTIHKPVQLLGPTDDWITVYPKEYEKAFKNPLKGFRPYRLDHEYGALIKTYFKWNVLENNASDGVDRIIEASNRRWDGFEKTNMKAIPRVYQDWPRQESGWPEDMTEGDYTSDQFKERAIALIKKLGQAWDNDPRVAYIEMGLIGQWGEQEFPDTTDEIKEAIAAQFNDSFKNKLVMIRWPNTYNDHIYNFGYYWDSFGHYDQEYCGFHISKTAPKWKTAVIGGEPAYGWGNSLIQPGENPDSSLKKNEHLDFIIERVRMLHANHLGWISEYNHKDEQVRAGAAKLQKALGHRFVITEFSYPRKIDNGTQFSVSFKVKNTGSSPFYYPWPVEISLLKPDTREVVWKQQYADVDIRAWLPGDKWDNQAQAYALPAATYTVNQNLELSGVEPGGYVLALAVLDPAGNLPSLRFAINNYYNGGRHPIGKVGVNQTIKSFQLAGFDDIQSDNSLYYDWDKE